LPCSFVKELKYAICTECATELATKSTALALRNWRTAFLHRLLLSVLLRSTSRFSHWCRLGLHVGLLQQP
ncbi:hypothetical protein KCU85_g231, partial [Aureobasidium melanogenum]